MKSIRGGMGLGDALYVQSIARHYVEQRGERLRVCTAWPDVFLPIRHGIELAPFRRTDIQILAHYSLRKSAPTRQWQDVCISAGLGREKVDLRLDWIPTSRIGEQLRETGKPVVCVQMPRAPMARTDGFGKELLPDCRTIQRVIDRLRGRALLVQIGSGKAEHRFDGIDVDLTNRTTVRELLDIAEAADAFLGFVSFLVPLAESFDKPALLVWSRRGLRAPQPYVRQITPQKVLEKGTSSWIMDDAGPHDIERAADDLL